MEPKKEKKKKPKSPKIPLICGNKKKKKKNQLIDTDNRLAELSELSQVLATGGWGWEEMGEGTQKVQMSSDKISSPGEIMHSMATRVNNIVLPICKCLRVETKNSHKKIFCNYA